MFLFSLSFASSLILFLRDLGPGMLEACIGQTKHNLDLVGVQEVGWEGSGTEPAGEYTLFYGKGNENHELGTGFFVHGRIIS
jgi:hypothetical protein